MNDEQRRLLAAKPNSRVQQFAAFLNWRGLQLERIVFRPDEIAKYNAPASGIDTYYMTTDLKYNLQINELNPDSPFTHQATVKADRYGISNVGWHPFILSDDDDELIREALRLKPWLDRYLYKNAAWLRNFKHEHPEFLVPSLKRRRGRRSR